MYITNVYTGDCIEYFSKKKKNNKTLCDYTFQVPAYTNIRFERNIKAHRSAIEKGFRGRRKKKNMKITNQCTVSDYANGEVVSGILFSISRGTLIAVFLSADSRPANELHEKNTIRLDTKKYVRLCYCVRKHAYGYSANSRRVSRNAIFIVFNAVIIIKN